MNTKKAIRWLEGFIYYADNSFDMPILTKDGDKAREIISLLQRGEKYEAMFRELEYKILNTDFGDGYYKNKINLERINNSIKQKYYQKEVIK